MTDLCLKREILEKLSHRGIMAYVAVSLAGDAEASTAVLAGLVRVQSAVMLEGLKELAVEAPTLAVKHKTKWLCGQAKPGVELQNLDPDRYRMFVNDLKRFWDFVNNGISPARLPPKTIAIPFSMGAKDGAAIRGFLRDHPNWMREHWQAALNNRARSVIVRSSPLFMWVGKLGEYSAGPLNEYGKPKEGTGKIGQAISIEDSNRAARQQLLSSIPS